MGSGARKFERHLLKLSLWRERLEGDFLEPFTQVVDLGFGILRRRTTSPQNKDGGVP
jgi:hypothetical protein